MRVHESPGRRCAHERQDYLARVRASSPVRLLVAMGLIVALAMQGLPLATAQKGMLVRRDSPGPKEAIDAFTTASEAAAR